MYGRYEGLQEIIREKDRTIEHLENDLTKAGHREEDLKQLHNNYFLQVQTLINQKAIGSPKEVIRKKQEAIRKKTGNSRKKAGQHRRKPSLTIRWLNYKSASKEKPDIEPEVKSEVNQEEKDLIQKECKYCKKIFYTDNIQKEYCCKDHKDQAYNEKRRKEREYRKNEVSG